MEFVKSSRLTKPFVPAGACEHRFFPSEGGVTRLIGDTSYWMESTVNQFEQRLDLSRFFRISRAAPVNLSTVIELSPVNICAGAWLRHNRSKRYGFR